LRQKEVEGDETGMSEVADMLVEQILCFKELSKILTGLFEELYVFCFEK
jgi:hypothetical protein